MAVKHPTMNDRYVLAIECDGATYHSSRTARERDRLRQDILEDMGWTFYRIWSTNWIKSPVTEGERLVAAVEQALATCDIEQPSQTAAQLQADNEEHMSEDDTAESSEQDSNDSYELVEQQPNDSSQSENCYGFQEMKQPDYESLQHSRHATMPLLSDYIELLVNCQFPIHRNAIARTFCTRLGSDHITPTVKGIIAQTLSEMDTVVARDVFVYPASYNSVPAYGRCDRSIQDISIEELKSALMLVCAGCIGATPTSLIDATVRTYGFAGKGSNISEKMHRVYQDLIDEGKLLEKDGKVKCFKTT